ncbi:MAG: XVIPCD domain-containing protein [Lysobacteraceae bacterium]
MASPTPNAQLEAALVQFGQQPGVSADQQAQLRSAITTDARLLGQMNQAAQAGHLQGFSLPAAGSTTPNHVGQYDLQTGVISLPATAFQPTGTAPSGDLKAVMQVQEMTIRFGNSTYTDPPQPGATTPPATHPVSQDMLDNLQSTINGSPVLAEQVKNAATTRDPGASPRAMLLENFDFVPANMHAGGTYDGRSHSMNVPALGLQTRTATNPQGNFNADDMTFVIGHEIQHGFNHPAKAQASVAFAQQAGQVVNSAAVVHDYTAPVRNYIQAGRDDEAKAEIAGWNAVLSRQQQINPNTNLATMQGLQTMSRQHDFVELDPATNTVVAKSGLTFNPDNTLSQSPANIAAMGQHYFNRPDPASAQPGQRPVNIGESGKTDYTNYYGTGAIETIIQAERQHAQHHPGVVHKLTIDMAGIGLRENLMEQEGINFKINKATPQPYYDTSQTPSAQGNFHHTQDGSVNAQHDHQHVPVAPSMSAPAGRNGKADEQDRPLPEEVKPERNGAVLLDNPWHQNHAMFATLIGAVNERDKHLGREPDEISRQLAGGLVEKARERGLDTIGAAKFTPDGTKVGMTDTADLSAPWAKTAVGDVGQLAGQKLSQSSENVAAINQQQALEQSLKPPAPTQGMDDPAPKGPRLV